MNITEAISFLKIHQEWRLGADIVSITPKELTEALKVVIDHHSVETNKMETKQTAVEWLFLKMNRIRLDYEIGNLNDLDFIENQKRAFKEAKTMEKEQIINAAYHGVDYEHSSFDNAEQYYEETYGK